jgi:hypothetical protein
MFRQAITERAGMEQLIEAAPLMRTPSEPTATTHVPLNTKRSAGAACNRGIKVTAQVPVGLLRKMSRVGDAAAN